MKAVIKISIYEVMRNRPPSGLAAIVELHELISEFFALRIGQFIALCPRPRGEHRAGGRFLERRFLVPLFYHVRKMFQSLKNEENRLLSAGECWAGEWRRVK